MAAAANGRLATAGAQGPPPPLAPLPDLPKGAPAPDSSASEAFPSHVDAPPGSLDPRVVTLCQLLSTVPAEEIEAALSRSGIPPIASIVEPVLRFSYSRPACAVRFFRWAALSTPHSPASWNLMVDLLGRNSLFEAMWDAIRSMRDEPSHPLSPSTFISAFSSYCLAGRVKEAFMTFEVMDRYGVPIDSFVFNSLLSAASRAGHTLAATDFLDRARTLGVSPDGDSYAILLEGWEREGNVASAKRTFGDMVVRLGWDTAHTPAHDAFLTTLIRAGETPEALKFLQVMRSKGCLPGTKFFSNALDSIIRANDLANASALWDTAVASGFSPTAAMYNNMITFHCSRSDISPALHLLDEMTLHGAFPDSVAYNTIFGCLIRGKKAREAERFFREMRKNEFPPSPANCLAAIRMFFDEYDPEAALEVWRCVVEENLTETKGQCANEVLLGLRDLTRMTDVKKCAEEMLDMGIELNSSTLTKLRSGFRGVGKLDVYDRIEKRATKVT